MKTGPRFNSSKRPEKPGIALELHARMIKKEKANFWDFLFSLENMALPKWSLFCKVRKRADSEPTLISDNDAFLGSVKLAERNSAYDFHFNNFSNFSMIFCRKFCKKFCRTFCRTFILLT